MKKLLLTYICLSFLTGCSHLTHLEKENLQILKTHSITVDRAGNYEAPNSALAAGLLNILPGFGNFYLAMGDGADSSHYAFGFVNLLLWPISILWAVPEGAIDAQTLNQRELLYYYKFNPYGQKELKQKGITLY